MANPTSSVDGSLFLITVGIIGMLLLAVAVVVFFLIYQKRLFVQQEEMRTLENAYQKDLLRASLSAQEEERKRVATDLHDGIGSVLSAIRLYLKQLSPAKPRVEFQDLVNETTEMVDTAIDQARKIAHNLLPTTLERLGFLRAVEELCNRIQKTCELEIQVEHDRELNLTQKQGLTLYRILQELINNTIKHAEASQVRIQFIVALTELQMIYSDDGKGIQPQSTNQELSGLGLKSIESRVQFLNAKMNIDAEVSKGFHFKVKIPLKEENTLGIPSKT